MWSDFPAFISQSIIEKHKGHIVVRSEIGNQTKFVIMLPLKQGKGGVKTG